MKSILSSLFDTVVQKVADEVDIELHRKLENTTPQKLQDDRIFVGKERSQVFSSMRDVEPEIGSILTVGLGFGVIEHTGIYVGDGYIIEQHGDDVLKQVTFQEFIDGDKELYARGMNIGIQIACDSTGKPLADKEVAEYAKKLYDDYERRHQEYSIVFNNCHQFCWECIAPKSDDKLVMFSNLEEFVAKHYGYVIYWDNVKGV